MCYRVSCTMNCFRCKLCGDWQNTEAQDRCSELFGRFVEERNADPMQFECQGRNGKIHQPVAKGIFNGTPKPVATIDLTDEPAVHIPGPSFMLPPQGRTVQGSASLPPPSFGILGNNNKTTARFEMPPPSFSIGISVPVGRSAGENKPEKGHILEEVNILKEADESEDEDVEMLEIPPPNFSIRIPKTAPIGRSIDKVVEAGIPATGINKNSEFVPVLQQMKKSKVKTDDGFSDDEDEKDEKEETEEKEESDSNRTLNCASLDPEVKTAEIEESYKKFVENLAIQKDVKPASAKKSTFKMTFEEPLGNSDIILISDKIEEKSSAEIITNPTNLITQNLNEEPETDIKTPATTEPIFVDPDNAEPGIPAPSVSESDEEPTTEVPKIYQPKTSHRYEFKSSDFAPPDVQTNPLYRNGIKCKVCGNYENWEGCSLRWCRVRARERNNKKPEHVEANEQYDLSRGTWAEPDGGTVGGRWATFGAKSFQTFDKRQYAFGNEKRGESSLPAPNFSVCDSGPPNKVQILNDQLQFQNPQSQTDQYQNNLLQNNQLQNNQHQNSQLQTFQNSAPQNPQTPSKPSFSAKVASAFLQSYLKDNSVSSRRASMLLDALIFYKNPAGEIGTKMISSSLLMISSDRLSDFVADFRCENVGVQVMLGMPQEIQEQALDFVLSFIHGDRFDQQTAEPILDQVFICASYLKVDQLIEEIKTVEEKRQTLDFTEVEAFLKQLAPPVFLPEVPNSIEFLPNTPILQHVSMSCFRLQVPVEHVQTIGQNLNQGLNQNLNQNSTSNSIQNSTQNSTQQTSNSFLNTNQVQPMQNSTPSFGNSPVQFENKNIQKTGNTALDAFFNSTQSTQNPQVQINSRPDFGLQIRPFQSLQNNQQNTSVRNRQQGNFGQFKGFNQQQTYQQTHLPVGTTMNKYGKMTSKPSIHVTSDNMYQPKPAMYAQSFQGEWNNTMDLLKLKNDGQDRGRFRDGAQKKI